MMKMMMVMKNLLLKEMDKMKILRLQNKLVFLKMNLEMEDCCKEELSDYSVELMNFTIEDFSVPKLELEQILFVISCSLDQVILIFDAQLF